MEAGGNGLGFKDNFTKSLENKAFVRGEQVKVKPQTQQSKKAIK